MTSAILIGTAVLLSQLLGMLFIHIERNAVLFHAGIHALISVTVYWLIRETQMLHLLPAAFLCLYLLDILILRLQTHASCGSCLLAFLLSFGSFAVFIPMIRYVGNTGSPESLMAGIALNVCFAAALYVFHNRFPDPDWADCFKDTHETENRLNLKRYHIYLVSFAACSGCVMLLMIDTTTFLQTVVVSAAGFLVMWISVLLIIIMIYYKKEKLTVLMEQQYREETREFMNVIRSQRHDYNFHVQTIAGLIEGNKIEECRSYVKALEKDSIEMNKLMPIRDPAISATLFSFQRLALREGIELHTDIQYDLTKMATNVYETNKILSNLLRNAIDEVSTHTDKSYGIWLTILKRGEYCVLQVGNKVLTIPSAEELGRIYDQGYSTKEGHEGVGLCSIRLLAKKYGGLVYTRLEDDVIYFTARIPINTAKQEEY